MSEKKTRARPVEPDPEERDEHAYEETWYRTLKAKSQRRHEDPATPDEGNAPATDG